MASEEIDHIVELQKKLYSRDPENIPERKYGILRPIRQSVESKWGDTSIPHPKKTRAETLRGVKRFFFFSLIFFIFAGGVALYSIYRGSVTLSSKNVEVTILGNSFVGAGEELPVQVAIVNKNSQPLQSAVLTLEYPKGAVDTGGGELVRDRRELGSINSAKSDSESFSAYLYGEQGTTRTLTANLEYKLSGSSATFVKTATFSVLINSSPLALSVDAPWTAAPNQTFTLRLHSSFTGDKAIDNAIVRVEYPNGFVYQSSVPAPVAGNNVWSLGDMLEGSEQNIEIKGKLVGEIGDEKAFRVYVGTPVSDIDPRIDVTYNSALHTMKIEDPFISGQISVGTGNSGDIVAVPIGSPVVGVISWTNNASIPVASPEFTLAITGDTVDFDSITAEGAYVDPLNRTITWNTNSSQTLSTLQPGAHGQFNFSFKTLEDAKVLGDVALALSVRGTFPDRDFAESSVTNIDQKIVRFASKLQFSSEALYSTGPFKNIGPFPPKANTETTYTITWTMLPVQNPLSQAKATATLPIGVTWAGTILPSSEALTYSPDTNTIVWDIGSLPKATALSANRTVSFQVKAKPTKSQVGAELNLLGETTITAKDAIAGVPLEITRPALSTRLFTDPSYTVGQEKVVP